MLVAVGVPVDAMSTEPIEVNGETSNVGRGQEAVSSRSGKAVKRSFERELGSVESGPASRDTCKAMEAAILSDQRRWERIAPSRPFGGGGGYPPKSGSAGRASGYEPFGSIGGVPPDRTNGSAYRSYVQRCP